jgi:phage terminase large subunit GpA-like protein
MRRVVMSAFLFSCPNTGGAIDPGIDGVEANHSDGIRFEALHVRCPHCGEHHEIKIEEEALNEAA